MAAPEVWVARDDGSELVRAGTIAAVSRDYNGTITIRLSGGEQPPIALVTVASHEGRHTPGDFHRQLLRAVAQAAGAAQAAVVRPEWDDHGWRWASEPL